MTKATPLFSIITITFNNRDGLASTAQSIAMQTCVDFEWIIIDGFSTDGTKEDFANYASAQIISEPDKGIYDAMNKGIDLARGDYLVFMNAGDCFATSDVLRIFSDGACDSPDLIYGDSFEGGHYKAARKDSYILWGMFTHHQAMFYRRESLGSIRYDTSYKIAADYDLTLRFLKSESRSLYLPFPVCIFAEGGVSQILATQGRNEQFLSRQKNKSCTGPMNSLIRGLQIILWQLRKRASPVYWIIKRLSTGYQ